MPIQGSYSNTDSVYTSVIITITDVMVCREINRFAPISFRDEESNIFHLKILKLLKRNLSVNADKSRLLKRITILQKRPSDRTLTDSLSLKYSEGSWRAVTSGVVQNKL